MPSDVDQSSLPPPSAEAPSFDLSKKKKKKKTKAVAAAIPSIGAPISIDDANTAASQSLNDLSLNDDDPNQPQNDDNGDQQSQQQPLDFALPSFGGKKKKKKKRKVDFGDDPTSMPGEEDGNGGLSIIGDDGKASEPNKRREAAPQPWDDDVSRDYTYAELINRAFQFLHGKNPALAAGASQRKRIRLELPQVAREGTKKTVFLNFGSICKSIHRQQDHLLAYMCAELGTTGNIQEGGRLVIKGRFGSEGIANVLKRYMLEYVICTSCRSPDTVLMRDANTRLYFVSCESCGAKRSVAPIRQGFMAQVEKRKK